jgi:hypothetical protein
VTRLTPNGRRRARLFAEIRRVAAGDLEHVAGEVRDLEEAVEDGPGEARDAYYRAVGCHGEAEAALRVARTGEALRGVARRAAAARFEIACARAALEGRPAPSDRTLCFFDPAHGLSARVVVFAPTGGPMCQLPACQACAEEVDAGRAPLSRKVMVDGRPQPYWRSPVHGGYYATDLFSADPLLGLALGDLAFEGFAGLAGELGVGAVLDWVGALLP